MAARSGAASMALSSTATGGLVTSTTQDRFTVGPRTSQAGLNWLRYASVMLALVGAFNVIDGIVALSRSKFYVAGATYVFSDLRTWGWIMLALGAVEVLAAVNILRGSEWSRWFGVGAAGLNAVGQLMFVDAYPFWSLSAFAMDVLVVYGLAMYGGRRGRQTA
jgi:hypothetical protein